MSSDMRGFGESNSAYWDRQAQANEERQKLEKKKMGRRRRWFMGGSGGDSWNDRNNRKTQRDVQKELDKEDQDQIDKYQAEKEEEDATS
jgi:hypothetical protein